MKATMAIGRIVGKTPLMSGIILLLLVSLAGTGCKDLGSTEMEDAGTISKRPEEPGKLYTVAGKVGELGNTGDGGPATEARFYWPTDITMDDLTGNLWITDWNNHCYRAVLPDGTVKRVVGNGRHGDDFDGDALEIASNHPGGMTVGPDGNFYLAIWHNWKIKIVDRASNYATTFAGTDAGFGGDSGPASLANLFLPSSTVFDPTGNMYISDQGNGRIRKVDLGGIISTFAGRQTPGDRDGFGYLASFSWSRGNDAYPGGRLAIDVTGENIYVADQLNHKIRKVIIADQMVTTIAGTGTAGYSGDGGPALEAELNYPCDVACAPNGDVYVADTRNHSVRKIDPAGTITTVVGTGVSGVSPDATLAAEAMLNYVSGLYFDVPTNTLYIADTYNSQVKRVKISE
jgi:sugar lactone lactonase YvrE